EDRRLETDPRLRTEVHVVGAQPDVAKGERPAALAIVDLDRPIAHLAERDPDDPFERHLQPTVALLRLRRTARGAGRRRRLAEALDVPPSFAVADEHELRAIEHDPGGLDATPQQRPSANGQDRAV